MQVVASQAMEATADAFGALREAVARVGDRWTLLIVDALLGGPRRFNDLADELPGIAPTTLSRRLKHLEEEGIVAARPYSARPPRFTYELTESGAGLADALRLLAGWAAGRDERIAHRLCGTALETRWFCPSCARTVDDPESDELYHA